MLSREKGDWKWLGTVLLGRCGLPVLPLALAVSVATAIVVPDSLRTTRYGDYALQVENLKAGRGFVDEGGRVLHRYPPAYPVVLWGLDRLSEGTGLPLYGVLAGFAAACNGAAAGLVFGLGRTLGLGVRQAASGAAAFAVHPFVLYGVSLPLSETPFMTVMCGSVMAALWGIREANLGRLALGGALAGLACLVRPIALLAPLVIGTAAAWKARGGGMARVIAGLIVVAAAGSVLLPWVAWIRIRTGEWVMVSSGGPPTLRDGLSFNHKAFRERLDLPEGVRRMSDAAWAEYDRLDSLGAYLRFVVRQAKADPWGVMQTYAYKAARAWYGTDAQRSGVERFNLVVSLCFLVAVGLGVWRLMRSGWPDAAAPLLALAALFWGMATVALSIARYTTPAVGLLAPFVGAAVGVGSKGIGRSGEKGG